MDRFRFPGKQADAANDSSPAVQGADPSLGGGGAPGKESFLAANKKYVVPGVAVLVGFGMIALFAAFMHRPSAKVTPALPDSALHAAAAGKQAQGEAQTPASTQQSSLPTDQTKTQTKGDQSEVSASLIQSTARTTDAGAAQPLGAVQTFQQPAPGKQIWNAPPYALAAGGAPPTMQEGSNLAQARVAQVSKPSLVFVLSNDAGTSGSGPAHGVPTAEEPEINNLGYEPGDHITTHLQSVATTATKAPVIAVVDYNYQRNGVTIVPAGSRIIGTIGQASSTGIMDIQFSTLHLPNGEDIPISAVGLDPQMAALKGTVTGRNRAKQFLIAAMAGLGETTALFAQNNNTTGTLSEGDMIRSQAAQNMGQAADSGIGQLNVSEHLVVTIPAGTKVEVTFTAPAKSKTAKVM
jgi:hypothetical protein